MGKREKDIRKKSNNKWPKVFVVILLVCLAFAICMLFYNKTKDENGLLKGTQKNVDIAVDEELSIVQVGTYEGIYMEDGSDETVEEVMMIVVKNTGERTMQYAELFLKYEDFTAEFTLSTLLPGAEMLVLEKNRLGYSVGQDLVSTSLENVVYFEEPISLCEDKIKIGKLHGALNIENISQEEVKGPIAIYYKTQKENLFYGGITYRAIVEKNLEAGEIMQVKTQHFSLEDSEILFVTYAP